MTQVWRTTTGTTPTGLPRYSGRFCCSQLASKAFLSRNRVRGPTL